MKVIKVIVDKVPESCKECIYPNWNSLGDRYCQAALRIIYDVHTRPDWCPLILSTDIEVWEVTRPPESEECILYSVVNPS